MEPDGRELQNVEICFTVQVPTRLMRDAFLFFRQSFLTTAQRNMDFIFFRYVLQIHSGFEGTTMRCTNIAIVGDDIPESNKVLVYEFELFPNSGIDRVVLQNGTAFDYLRVNIIDNDGK